jgi:hypothetical protein
MLIYPQLSTGAVGQYPVVRKRSIRTVVNVAADGTRVAYSDPAGGAMTWRLEYRGLSDGELNSLQAFHAAAEGSLNGFTFVDPGANLLAWSEDLINVSWTSAPLLSITGAVNDAFGKTAGFQITNLGGGPQSITQTLNAPAGYLYCFSVYLRAPQPTAVQLQVGKSCETYTVGPNWTRLQLARSGDATAASITFGLELAADTVIDIFGPQVEAQAGASGYKTSTTGGVYENARLLNDTLQFTTTDLNRHSATVSIYYANHL